MENNKVFNTFVYLLFITMLLAVVTQDTGAGNNHVERMAKVNQLLEAAVTKSPSRPIPEEILKETDIAIRNQYNEERRRLVREEEDKREQARNELAGMGDEIINQLLEKYHKSVRYEQCAVYVLKKIGSPRAKESLLNLVLTEDGKPNGAKAMIAQSYVEIAQDKDEIKKLLVSNKSGVLGNALRGMVGIKVDAQLLKRLDEILQSVRYSPSASDYLRTNAAIVIAADTSNELMQEKVLAIVKSIQTVEKLKGTNEREDPSMTGTFADNMYSQLSHTLRRMKDKDIDNYLSEATSALTGNPRRWILTTRAKLGDVTVKNEIKKILEDPNMLERTSLRSSAIGGLKEIGTAEDIPFLRNIAETDPVFLLRREDVAGGPILEMIDNKPINNTGERTVIYDEYSILDWWGKADRKYFIRSQAELAIEAIKNRENND